MTNLIPDSWELPSYLAGDVLDMGRYRDDRDRFVVPDKSWKPGQDARVHEVDFAGTHRMREQQQMHPAAEGARPPWTWSQSDIEPYDPAKHLPPAELYSQHSLDALEKAGFQPHEDGVWHRPVTTDEGEHLGASHIIVYNHGHRRPTDNSRAPWHLMTDPESAGLAFSTLRGPRGAIAAADEDVSQIRKMPKHARMYLSMVAAQSPGRANADDWLARNSEESFERDPRQQARDWMDQHAHEYGEWHPESEEAHAGVDYSDFRDPAGMTFGPGGEEQSHVMPGSAYDWSGDDGWERFHAEREARPSARSWSDQDHEDHEHYRQPSTRQDGYAEGDDAESPQHEQDLADLGFNWQHRGDPNTTPVGVYQEGEYVRHQHDPEGNHIATHTLHKSIDGRWQLESGPSDTQDFLTSYTSHQFPHDAISKYHDNAEQALLPSRGYEPHRGRNGSVTHWTRTDTGPTGDQYEHEISNQPPSGEGNDQGWLGHTVSEGMIAPSYGTRPLQSSDLADVVREQDRTGRGLHPGGAQDYRITRGELLGDPSVARLGASSSVSDNFHEDNKVGSAHWHWPHPGGSHLPHVNAEATYNWDKGGYDFKYTHDGNWLAASHNAVPDGAPIHVPGRQSSLDFPVDHPFNINDYRGLRT